MFLEGPLFKGVWPYLSIALRACDAPYGGTFREKRPSKMCVPGWLLGGVTIRNTESFWVFKLTLWETTSIIDYLGKYLVGLSILGCIVPSMLSRSNSSHHYFCGKSLKWMLHSLKKVFEMFLEGPLFKGVPPKVAHLGKKAIQDVRSTTTFRRSYNSKRRKFLGF